MPISSLKRFLIGGIGGLAPVIALLITVDFEKNFANATSMQMVGFFVRATALFAIGGFVAWLHETEDKTFKVFEIGLGAPALIAGVVTSHSLAPTSDGQATQIGEPVSMSIFPKVYAQTSTTRPTLVTKPAQAEVSSAVASPTKTEIKQFTFPGVSTSSQFWEGFLGLRTDKPKNVYFTIVGSHLQEDQAIRQAEEINARQTEFKADVYAPFGENPYYAVVIGTNLLKSEARALRDSAKAAGLSSDAYIWTTPNLRY